MDLFNFTKPNYYIEKCKLIDINAQCGNKMKST